MEEEDVEDDDEPESLDEP